MTRFIAGCLVCLGLAATPGCGSGAPSTDDPGTPAPHKGSVIPLPGGGFLEVVKTEAASPRAPVEKEGAFYFLKDMETPMSPAPKAATLAVGKKKIELQVDGEALVTPPGPPIFPKGGLDGVLAVEIDNQPRNIPLGIR
ncbi:hypothetical protein [Paludisphaera mucosa]|uniref:Lipoprotein n=1 Tax=Paludisphaera mucosa TaxID=3030827 RepID=A0ABT6FBD7_9BACT|nr:hypothetical protein [Paludisphaera mucosa]MDG3004865.1 hypothetical protein [Paludisphaera mucosa]